MRASTIAIIMTLLILGLFAGFTIYGNKVGNFVINVDNDKEIDLSLSVQEDLSKQTERLVFDGNAGIGDTTYGQLPPYISQGGLGDKSVDRFYMAYTFYLINNSDRAVDIDMDLKLVDVVGDPLSVLRVMLIEGDNSTFAPGNRIYAQPETTEAAAEHLQTALAKWTPYETEPFHPEEEMIFSVTVKDMPQGANQKYTVVLWIEGCDLECTDERLGDRVKMQLDITGY